ncbi:hypothetical protein HMPREF9554_02353 [Treponema phagedenis F0421]|nr:hypothetical protein HMPREF9554_02353 [Treponema phagedenis F0421]
MEKICAFKTSFLLGTTARHNFVSVAKLCRASFKALQIVLLLKHRCCMEPRASVAVLSLATASNLQ